MENIENLFDVAIHETVNAYPSIFSKEDVEKLIESLKNSVLAEVNSLTPTSGITEKQFQEFNSNVRHRLERTLCNDRDELVDYSSVEFTIDYGNQLSVENIDVNVDLITEELDDILLNEFEICFGSLIIKNEE